MRRVGSGLGSAKARPPLLGDMSDASNEPVEPMDSELRDAAVSGVRWLAIARVISDGLQFVAAVALARLIAPAEFGNAAVALIFVPLSVILTSEQRFGWMG